LFDEDRWRTYIREHLAIGARTESEYPTVGSVNGIFGDRLEFAPVLILQRFSQSEVVIAGCRVRQFDTQGVSESFCLLDLDDLRYLIEVLRPVVISNPTTMPQPSRFSVTTRTGFAIHIDDVFRGSALVSAACARSVTLSNDQLLGLIDLWQKCLELVVDL